MFLVSLLSLMRAPKIIVSLIKYLRIFFFCFYFLLKFFSFYIFYNYAIYWYVVYISYFTINISVRIYS